MKQVEIDEILTGNLYGVCHQTLHEKEETAHIAAISVPVQAKSCR